LLTGMLRDDATGRLGPSFMFLSLAGRRRLPRPAKQRRRCRAIAAPALANSARCPDPAPDPDIRRPKHRLACRLPDQVASDTVGLAGDAAAPRSGGQIGEFSRMLAQPAPARHAGAPKSGLLRFLRTSLTSAFRVSRRVGEREGKRSARCERLPSRSRRCRARIWILAAALVRLLPNSCHQGGTAHLVLRRLTTLNHGLGSERLFGT